MGSPSAGGLGPGEPEGWTPPSEFEEYRLVRLVGQGGTGQVYLAQDTLLERAVAVKFIPSVGAEALARFLLEARAAARVQHPNVATLYRVGQWEERPYLVSEYVRGTRLDRLARPLPWERVVELGKGLARGLEAAHRRGVLHRDVKPGNAILAESGEVKLLDFGLAQLVGPAPVVEEGEPLSLPTLPEGHLVGTPYYMSPEAWWGGPLTVRSDVYSLGVVLYELCAGQGPFREVPWTQLAVVVTQNEARPLAEAVPGVERGFAAVVDKCLRLRPEERWGSAAAVWEALEELRREPVRGRVPEGNPYRGLRAFEAEHRALFFGREREQRAVLERLRAEGLVVVAGDSGVGKSSLCLAGVVPAVAEGALGPERQWECVRLVPGRHPVRALAAALAGVLGEEEGALEGVLAAEPGGLVRRVRARLGGGRGLLVYVDQLEELVTLAGEEERARAGEALGALAGGVVGVRVLASCRSDFLTRLTGVEGLGVQVPEGLYLLRALGREEAREAVVGPARMKGVGYETERLVERLVEAAGGGGLPLLQFTLAELWEARGGAGCMTEAALEGLGGVEGALARHADGVVEGLLPEQREAAREVLLRLVTAEGTRGRKTEGELGAEEGRYRAALEGLVKGRLVVAREEGGATSYELAHEALVRGWGMLARWLGEAAEHREVQGRLEAAAAVWERQGRARDWLWGERQLREAAVLEPERLTWREQAFVEASRRAVARRRWLRWGMVAGFVLCMGGVYGGVQWRARAAVESQVRGQLAVAEVELVALRQEREALAARRAEALRLYDEGRKTEADEAWERLEQVAAGARVRLEAVGDRLERVLTVASARRDVREAMGEYLLERVLLAEQQGDREALPGLLQRLRLYDEQGERWRTWIAPARLTLQVGVTGAVAELRKVWREAGGREQRGEAWSLGAGPWEAVAMPAGDWWLEVRAPGYEAVGMPLKLERGEQRRLEVPLLRQGQVPEGYVYVPPGRVLFGSAAEAPLREFFNTVPLHERPVEGFLMARHETTYGEWLTWLDSLPREERERRTPRVGVAYRGMLALERVSGRWRLRLHTGGESYEAWAGERLRYARREQRAEQDCRRPRKSAEF